MKSREQSVDGAIQRWEAQLSADERKRLGPTDLRLHLPLDEQQGETAADHSTTPHRTATVKGRAAWVEGRLGRALDLNGQTHIDAGELGTVEADEPFTLAVWIRPSGTTAAAILSKMDDAQAFRGYDITIENGRIASHLIDHWPDNGLKVITKQPVALSAWASEDSKCWPCAGSSLVRRSVSTPVAWIVGNPSASTCVPRRSSKSIHQRP